MFGLFQKRKQDAQSSRRKQYIPSAFRRTRSGPFGLFAKRADQDTNYGRRRGLTAYLRNAAAGLLGLFTKNPAVVKQSSRAADYLPSELRRPPFYKRLPEWSAQQAAGSLQFLARLPVLFLKLFRLRLATWFLCAIGFTAGGFTGALLLRHQANTAAIVAAAKGSAVTDQQFYHRLETIAGPQAMSALASERLLLQFAGKKQALPSESEISARVQEIKSRPGAGEMLRKQCVEDSDLRETARIALAEEHLFGSAAQVSDAEIRAYYTQQASPKNLTARFYTPERMACSIIVSRDEQTIRKAWQMIQAGRPFEQAAKTYSTDRTAPAGGIMEPFYRGRYAAAKVPGFEEAVFGLQPGETLPPRRLGGAWFILRCREKSPAFTRSLDSVRDECRRNVLLAKSARINGPRIASEYAEFCAKAKVQIFWDGYLNDLAGRSLK